EGALRPFPDIAEDATARAGQDGPGDVELVADQRIGRGREILPLGLGRKPGSGPAGEGVGLIMVDVGDRRRPVDLAASGEGELGAVLMPVKRRADPLLLDPGPAVRQPQRRRPVAARSDDLAPFAITDLAPGELVRGEEGAVPRPLAVEGEAAIG